jgi:hypothetical protein
VAVVAGVSAASVGGVSFLQFVIKMEVAATRARVMSGLKDELFIFIEFIPTDPFNLMK